MCLCRSGEGKDRIRKPDNMNTLHFHFNKDLHAAQIQQFAKVVKCMIDDEFGDDYKDMLQWEWPSEAENVEQLQSLSVQLRDDYHFFISTPKYKDLEYTTERNTQVSFLVVNLALTILQGIYSEFKEDKIKALSVEVVDKMLGCFSNINTFLTNYFMKEADDQGFFSWKTQYGPGFFDLKRFSFVRDLICGLNMTQREHKELSVPTEEAAKGVLMSFLYQCGYMAFWCCLADVLTFPGCSPQEKEVLVNLANFLREHYANLYVYNLAVEADGVIGGNVIEDRGSAENTTRIKLYFTRDDGSPVMMRLDLPHEGCKYVHLNIEEGSENQHVALSKEALDDEYDHVFDNLAKALNQYNFNASKYDHLPSDKDKVILRDMCYRTALFTYAPNAAYYLMLGSLPEADSHPMIRAAVCTLKELLSCDGITPSELEMLNPPELLGLAYSQLYGG